MGFWDTVGKVGKVVLETNPVTAIPTWTYETATGGRGAEATADVVGDAWDKLHGAAAPPALPPPTSNAPPALPPPTDPTQVDQDRSASRDLLAHLLGQYDNYQGQAAPQAGYSTAAPVATSQGNTSEAASWAPVATAQGGQVTAAQVAPMSFGGPMSAGASSSGAAQQALAALADPATTYAGAQIDKTDSNELRARQLSLADAITAAMNGQGTSVAQQQLQMGLDQALQQQAAIAASSRGQNVGLGQYNAAIQGGALSGQANAQAALLRAQEIAQARAQLGDVLNTTRAGDINLAENQAGLTNQAGMFSADQVNRGNQFNAGQKNTVGMFNADQSNQNQRLDAQLGTQASIASMTSGNQYNAQMNALAQALAIQNGQWNQDTSLSNAQLGQQNSQFNAGQSNSYNQAVAAALQQNNQFNATQGQQNSQFNAGQSNAYNMNQAGLTQGVNLANLGAQLQTQGLNQQGQNNLLAAMLTGNGQLLGADASMYGTQTGASTQLGVAQMQSDLARYLQQQSINDKNNFNMKDYLNAITGIVGVTNQK